MTDLDTLGYPEHLYRLRGYISSLHNSVVQAAWVNRAQEILDEAFAQHSALVEHARTLEHFAQGEAESNQALHERIATLERERDEAQEALQNLAADHYFARAEKSEAQVAQLTEALRERQEDDENRAALYKAQVEQLAGALEDLVAATEPEAHRGGGSLRADCVWCEARAALDAARPAEVKP